MDTSHIIRQHFLVTGQVQGVGFRPFIYRQAKKQHLSGFVSNTARGVEIEVQGSQHHVAHFSHLLQHPDKAVLPPLAVIYSCQSTPLPLVKQENDFTIKASVAAASHTLLPSPDVATCTDCLADVLDVNNRRHRYIFTNCTNCGPRYTIIRSLPYDRASTSMACFPLCPACQTEYTDPLNRRFHAQPNACPLCGPHVWLQTTASQQPLEQGDAAIAALATYLLQRKTAAIKGLGGFHLACLATDAQAVQHLRQKKQRPHKSLAIMVSDLESARKLAHITAREAILLESFERPIVLCPKREESELSNDIAPDTGNIGIMLPYTPLHHMLFAHLSNKEKESTTPSVLALVMTSANSAGEPIALGNREALARLQESADIFLLHNRDILIRTDDSVLCPYPPTALQAEELAAQNTASITPQLFLRRARGYVPRPVLLPATSNSKHCPPILAFGADLKNTFCLTKGQEAFVSQHIGDMDTLATEGFFMELLEHKLQLLQCKPEIIVCDAHPNYKTSALAKEWAQAQQLPLIQVQHHTAHLYAVLAEQQHTGAALGLALDGTGYGLDGTMWGGELLLLNASPSNDKPSESIRMGHIQPLPLPGGDAAVREPWRIAHAILYLLHEEWPQPLPLQYREAAQNIPFMLEQGINTPYASSCGRLFDAVSALCGLCHTISYEGQAAIRLEHALSHLPSSYANEVYTGEFVYEHNSLLCLNSLALCQAVVDAMRAGITVPRISQRFHNTLAANLADMCTLAMQRTGIRHIALSGGVFQNTQFTWSLHKKLLNQGAIILQHKSLPPNDACISLGQAAYVRQFWKQLV